MKNVCELPEDCLSHILSLTSPADVLRSSAVSKQFLSLSVSNTVWRNFLPSDCEDIISQSSSSIVRNQFASEKELFLHLARFPVLLDDNTMSFGLEKSSGNICYMLSARALAFTWGSTPNYWGWEALPESKFPECVLLMGASLLLGIKGEIDTTLLSPATTYVAYFVFKFFGRFYTALEYCPMKVSVVQVSEDELVRFCHKTKSFYLIDPESLGRVSRKMEYAPEELPVVRGDGWLEIEMGKFKVGADNDRGFWKGKMLEMSLREIRIGHSKNC